MERSQWERPDESKQMKNKERQSGKNNADSLSPQQAKVYRFLKEQVYASGSMPTLREICSEMGWKAVGSAQDVVQALIEKGRVKKDPQKARALSLTDGEDFRSIPILGSAPAGVPIESVEYHRGDAVVPAFIRGPVFAVRVQGDSMENAGIEDGDLAIVKQAESADHDEIVVAMVAGEVTIKRFIKKQNEIWLQPENEKYKPKLINDSSFRILGKVIGVHRYFDR
ncbi:MAG: lexA [Bacteriovoracaceae bacterium]|nr:lexA [Bacteriovoracaceae bacterium]